MRTEIDRMEDYQSLNIKRWRNNGNETMMEKDELTWLIVLVNKISQMYKN